MKIKLKTFYKYFVSVCLAIGGILFSTALINFSMIYMTDAFADGRDDKFLIAAILLFLLFLCSFGFAALIIHFLKIKKY